jgi:hypothetical protein
MESPYMPSGSTLAISIALIVVLSALVARADGPSVSSSNPAPVPAVDVPVRASRNFAIMAESGWNSLGGTGIALTYNLTPHVSLDGATGLGLEGWKVGGQVRYNFLLSSLTPFVAAGFMWTSGINNNVYQDANNPSAPVVHVSSAPFAEAVAGLDLTTRGGFELRMSLGYARVLSNNLTFVGGSPTPDDVSAWRIVTGSGLVASLGIGYAF